MLAVSWSNKCAPHCHFMGPLLTLMTWSRISNWNISSSLNMHQTLSHTWKKIKTLWWVCLESVYSVNGYLMSSWSVIYGIGIEKGNYSSPYLASPWRTQQQHNYYGLWTLRKSPPRGKKGQQLWQIIFPFLVHALFLGHPCLFFFSKNKGGLLFLKLFALEPKINPPWPLKIESPKEGAAGTKNQ